MLEVSKFQKSLTTGGSMDYLFRSYENKIRNVMEITGELYKMAGTSIGMNPFAQPIAQAIKDYGSFLKEKAAPISESPWMTENKGVYRGTRVNLRRFSSGNNGNPLLLVPPEAGHNSQIVDYGPGQSLVQCALDHFDGDVYVMDKLPARPEHASYSLEDSIRSVDKCIEHIGEPVNLVGLCQGGWQSAIYTTLFAEKIKTLSLAGAPIDFHAGESIISDWARALPTSIYQLMVAMGGGLMTGAFITAGFKLMNTFDRFIGDDMNLYRNINDPEYLERSRRFNQWFEYTQPLSGTMYLEVVEHLFKENKLVKGDLEIMGQKVDLSRIHQPLFLIAGANDTITPPPQLFAIREYVSSDLIKEEVAHAGHIGVFMRTRVIDEIWTDTFKQLSSIEPDYRFDIEKVQEELTMTQ
jgi:poly(3-hydroxyalkanoate) synthetase